MSFVSYYIFKLFKQFQYPYEALFRSEQYALVDNACREYLFITEFFIVAGQQAQDLFNIIMGKTMTLMIVSYFKIVFDNLKYLISINNDNFE